ncbi:MAG: hypothetical protein QM726_18645 [Chitinophagaceae bacterium]
MKKILLLSTAIAAFVLVYKPANAQFSASVNIGVQPAWGPSGYDYAENYYLPDVEAYYNVPSRQFVYFDRGNWVYAPSLPARCGNYDLYGGYKVVINGRNPWFHFNDHRAMYAPYRFRHDQIAIRDFHGPRGGYYGNDYRFDNRGRGRDWGYDRRGDWGRDNRRHDDRGRGRW